MNITDGRRPHRRVLVIDDEPMLGRLMQTMLAKLGDIELVGTLDEAIASLQGESDVDLILCDLGLPGGSGHRLHAWIRSNRPGLLAKIGFVTGGACSPDAQSFLDKVSPPTLLKPFSRLELLEFTDTLLAEKS